MDTAIGVFTSRDRAEEAVKDLLNHGLPQESLLFLTCSENEADTVARHFGGTVGGFMGGAAGMSAGVLAATLLLPDMGVVFALGIGGAALLGIAGVGAGGSIVSAAVRGETGFLAPPEDVEFFREVLKSGRSLIVVRTNSAALSAVACSILDRLGIAMESKAPDKIRTEHRYSGEIAIIDVAGRINLGEGNIVLRRSVDGILEKGYRKVIINLADVQYVDSSGLGELVKTHTTIRNRNGHLKLASVSRRVQDLLHVTRIDTVLDIAPDEPSAIAAFGSDTSTHAVA